MDRRFAIAGLAVAGAIALGVVSLGPPAPRPAQPVPASAAGSTPAAPPTETVKPAGSATVTEAEPVAPGMLTLRRTGPEPGGNAEACLVFSAPLNGTGAVRYADFIELPANVKAALRVDGRKLCLSGLAYGVEHSLTLRAGLPGADGEKLAAATQVTVTLSDRPASVSFGSGYVLPRETLDGLPITTVNTDKLEIRVYRVGDRMLARMRQDFVDEKQVYPYRATALGNDEGQLVWTGTMPVTGPRNDAVVSLFPLDEAIGKGAPGAYLVVARNPDAPAPQDGYYSAQYQPMAAQWVVQSDLGLTAFSGEDGLTLVVRSLETAKPVAGVRLTLVARNNEELGTATSDGEGRIRFDPGLMRGPGGLQPVMVMAYAGTDFAFLDLRRAAFDLSDRGVDGRAPAASVDAFLYTDRGIYRPGETVQLVALMRDAAAEAITGRPLVVKVIRPNGKEYRRFTLKDAGAGGFHHPLALPATAARGQWEVTAHVDPEGEAVGRASFDVQDFVPQRLGLAIGKQPPVLLPGAPIEIPVDARFLYGAPASALTGEAEMIIGPDPSPFPSYKGFRWGIADEAVPGDRIPLTIAETDGNGHTTVTGALPARLKATRPLRAEIAIALHEPGGRTTSEQVSIPIVAQRTAIGLRPLFEGSVREGREAAFEIIALDETGQRVARPELEYRLVRDSSYWQWYRTGNSWRYERVPRETEVAGGKLSVGVDAPAQFRRTSVGWGSYRLIVTEPATGAATSVAFWGGWYGGGTLPADRPDRLPVALDKAGYAPGETARLHVESDVAGEALLVIANERVQETRSVRIAAGGSDISIAVKPEWGAGAYALLTLYRPLSEKLGHAPVRAVGTAWLALDPALRTLDVALEAPAQAPPRGRLVVPVKVTGGSRAFVTLAAVDQGILQLTRHKSPAPQKHYLAKRRLGVEMRDDYGRLIRGLPGNGDGQGGDAVGGTGLDVVPTKTVALFSGIVAVGADGTAKVPLDIPDFQGELRLMAVAFDGRKLGSAEARLTVRDPVVAELVLPRFLAPGDDARATVLLHNVDGAEGDYRVAVRATGAIGGEAAERSLPLAKGQREMFTVPLSAGQDAGIGTVTLSATGPAGFKVSHAWPIQVRPAQLPETRQQMDVLAPGMQERLGPQLLAGFLPGTASLSVSVSRWQGLDVPGLLRWLDRYPFGCIEQTTSRAMPLLYFNDVALLAGAQQDKAVELRVQDAVERVLTMQTPEGDFGMWGAWGVTADRWISVFALDFLTRAADKGYDVPEAPLALGRTWLSTTALRDGNADTRAYAAAVLARAGTINAGDLRYFYDTKAPNHPLALAQLGAALDAVGERGRAGQAYASARAGLTGWSDGDAAPYGSQLRDSYAVAAVIAAAGRSAEVPVLLKALPQLVRGADHTTTQEKAWMLLAAAEMSRNAGRLALEVDGKPTGAGDPRSLPLSAADAQRGVTLRNTGDGDLYRMIAVEGVPTQPLPETQNGVSITKGFFTLTGEPLSAGTMKRNDRAVVVLSGRADRELPGDYAVLDLLPAGWEIEAALRPGQEGFAWLGELSDAHLREARDDRFVAALGLPTNDGSYYNRRRANWNFKVAYVVRAVTPGRFVLPAVRVEHMYEPEILARTGTGGIEIAE